MNRGLGSRVLALVLAVCGVGETAQDGPLGDARGIEQALSLDASCFPYRCGPAPNAPWLTRYRAERRSPVVCALNVFRYLLKYRQKLRVTSAEEARYFQDQRQLVEFLGRESGEAAGASLAMVGDLMWLRTGWDDFLAPEVLDYLNRHTVVLGSLETTIARSMAVPRLLPDYLCYNSPPALLASFRRPDGRSTFTALSVASNHALDHREQGLRETAEFLKEQGILPTGARLHPADRRYVVFRANGITIGFYAAAWGVPRRRHLASRVHVVDSLAPRPGEAVDISPICDALREMAEDGVDFKVVSLHWGFEFELYPDPKLMQIAHEVVRAGADVLMGSHPHVVQPLEVCFVNGYERRYGPLMGHSPAVPLPAGCILRGAPGRPRKALIAYSLGNFTTAMYTLLCRVGAVQTLELYRDRATGDVDWRSPSARLVCNVPKHPATGARRLVFLDSLIAEHPGYFSKRQREDLTFLTEHVAVRPLRGMASVTQYTCASEEADERETNSFGAWHP